MILSGRMASVAIVAAGLGFVAGAWFISSGYGFSLVPVPKLPPPPTSPRKARRPPGPQVDAVGVPKVANFSGGSAGLPLRAARADLLPSPSCNWQVEPRPFRPDGAWLATDPDRALGGYSTVDPSRGGFVYLLTQSTRNGTPPLDLRPVFFDEGANRLVPLPRPLGSSSGSGGSFTMTEFTFEPDRRPDLARIAYFGIERVVPDAARFLAEAAQAEAKASGMTILPDTLLGQPYRFELLGVDGQPIRSEALKGRVVVVTVTGSDQADDLGLAVARRLRATNPPDQLAFVHVAFDATADLARGRLADSGLDGPLVVIPNDPTTRRIWRDGSRIDRLPKFFVLDREGTCRFVSENIDLLDRVDILFGRAKRPSRVSPWPGVSPAPAPAPAPAPGPGPKAR